MRRQKMDEFEILKDEILDYGLINVWDAIESIKDARWRAIDRLTFFEVVKTLPIELEKPDIIDMIETIKTF